MPATNISGNITTDPMPGADLPFGATEAITSPMASIAAAPSRKTSTNADELRGDRDPSTSRPDPITSDRGDRGPRTKLISSCAPSSRAGCTGVVDILRSTPRSR